MLNGGSPRAARRCDLPARGSVTSGLRQREQRPVEELIPKTAVEALDEAILHRLAGRDIMPFDAGLICPCEDRVAGELAAISGTIILGRPRSLTRRSS
jgi:hypothetical protein